LGSFGSVTGAATCRCAWVAGACKHTAATIAAAIVALHAIWIVLVI
jgi:uncharacterized Zn finger protein